MLKEAAAPQCTAYVETIKKRKKAQHHAQQRESFFGILSESCQVVID